MTCRVVQDLLLIITYHHFRAYQHEKYRLLSEYASIFFLKTCSVQAVFKLIFVASVTFVTSPTDGHLSTLSHAFKLEAMQMHKEAHGNCHHNFLQLYLLKNELEKPSLRPRLSRLMLNLDIPHVFPRKYSFDCRNSRVP